MLYNVTEVCSNAIPTSIQEYYLSPTLPILALN